MWCGPRRRVVWVHNGLHLQTVVKGAASQSLNAKGNPPAWSCKQRIVHLRPNSASASPSGVGRERLKRCLTFWTACSLQQASPSRDLHACQCSQLQSPRRLPEIGSLAPLLAGGGPAYPGCPSAVSHWQGMLLSLCTFRYAYHFVTTGMWRPKNFVLAKGGRHFQTLLLPARVQQLRLRPLPETAFGAR